MERRVARRGTVVSLAVTVGVSVAATAVFVVLYVMKQTDIGQAEAEIATTGTSLADENARLAAAKSTVDELGAEWSRLSTANAELRACADPARDSVRAAQRQDTAAFEVAMDKVFTNCRR